MADITFGSEYVFNEAASYLSNNDSIAKIDDTHFVFVYIDGGNSSYGTAVIGTISGNVISYGSEYVFNSASTYVPSVALIDSTHFVVSYQDGGNSSYGTSIIGTISGSTISFGSEYVFNSSSSLYCLTRLIDSTHFVVSYRDIGDSSYGKSVIGTISNDDEIAFGSTYTFKSSTTFSMDSKIIDSTHFVICYRDFAFLGYGRSIIGTISNGNEIAFGSEYTFNSAATNYISVSKIDSSSFIISYADTDNSSYGTSIIGTISGSTISFGNKYVFNSGSTERINVTSLDSTHISIVYTDVGNSSYGTGIVGILPSPSTFIPRTMWF